MSPSTTLATRLSRSLGAAAAHAALGLLALSCGGTPPEGTVSDDEGSIGAGHQAVLDGPIDVDTPFANSVGRLYANGSGCTGTLVAPDLVLSAAHCYAGLPEAEKDGQWHTLPTTVIFRLGVTGTAGSYNGQAYSVPPKSANGILDQNGVLIPAHADIMLFRLNTSVPAALAIPRAVAVDQPGDIGTDMCTKGYASSTTRRWTSSFNYRDDQDPNFIGKKFRGNVDYWIEQGDSGGPTFLYDCDGPVIGITQGTVPNSPVFVGIRTSAVAPSRNTPDIGAWLEGSGAGVWKPIEYGREITVQSQTTNTFVSVPLANTATAADSVYGSTSFLFLSPDDEDYRGQVRVGDRVLLAARAAVDMGNQFVRRNGSGVSLTYERPPEAIWVVEAVNCGDCTTGTRIESGELTLRLRADNGRYLKAGAGGLVVYSGTGDTANWSMTRASAVALRVGDILALRSIRSAEFLGGNPLGVGADQSIGPVPVHAEYYFWSVGTAGPLISGAPLALANVGGYLKRVGTTPTLDINAVPSTPGAEWRLESTTGAAFIYPGTRVRIVSTDGKRLKEELDGSLSIKSGAGTHSEWVALDIVLR